MSIDSNDSYELLDFGCGRKLERFGAVVLDRPSPAAEGVQQAHADLWKLATVRYRRTQGEEGTWTPADGLRDEWNVSFPLALGDGREQSIVFQLQGSPFGHVGVFAEQAANWEWLARQVARHQRPLKVLNLFAYTGGSTLAAAAAGAEVVHVDSARNIVARARQNAELSGLAERPIRWITEDALKFCQREVKRGNAYDAVILDPPTYGHGPKGERWSIGDDLLPLLELVGELTAESRAFLLATCHSPAIGPAELAAYMAEGVFGHCGQPAKTGELYLTTADGRRLPSGVVARWPN